MKSRISAPVWESRLPVGSSAKITSGRRQARGNGHTLLLTAGEFVGFVAETVGQTDRLDHLVEERLIGFVPAQVDRQGDVLESGQGRHEVEGLEDEADLVAPQQREVLLGECREVRFPDEDLPLVSRSSPARQCINVDLPEPEGPMIAVNCPWSNETSTLRRAVTCVSPEP